MLPQGKSFHRNLKRMPLMCSFRCQNLWTLTGCILVTQTPVTSYHDFGGGNPSYLSCLLGGLHPIHKTLLLVAHVFETRVHRGFGLDAAWMGMEAAKKKEATRSPHVIRRQYNQINYYNHDFGLLWLRGSGGETLNDAWDFQCQVNFCENLPSPRCFCRV